MKGFCPLASGSKGNCIYLGTDQVKLLIDAGIGVRRVEKSLKEIGVGLDEIDAILITHEHADHIRGLQALSCRRGIPVFANSDTAKGILASLNEMPPLKIFTTGEAFEFGDLKIHPFSIQHDTLDPVAFTFTHEAFKLGVCTDLGFVTSLVREHLKGCDYLYVESNHEPDMVYASGRPMIYKQRVLGRQGHLSNGACAELLKEIAHDGLKHVYLAHLSEECNNPHLALEVAQETLSALGYDLPVWIAQQHVVSPQIAFNHASV